MVILGYFRCKIILFFLGAPPIQMKQVGPCRPEKLITDVRSYEPQFGGYGWSTSVFICKGDMTGFLIFLTWCIYCSISSTYFLGCITIMYQSTWWLVTSVQTWSWKAGNIYNRKATLCTELQVHISIYYMSGFALICHVLCSIHFVVVHY